MRGLLILFLAPVILFGILFVVIYTAIGFVHKVIDPAINWMKTSVSGEETETTEETEATSGQEMPRSLLTGPVVDFEENRGTLNPRLFAKTKTTIVIKEDIRYGTCYFGIKLKKCASSGESKLDFYGFICPNGVKGRVIYEVMKLQILPSANSNETVIHTASGRDVPNSGKATHVEFDVKSGLIDDVANSKTVMVGAVLHAKGEDFHVQGKSEDLPAYAEALRKAIHRGAHIVCLKNKSSPSPPP